MTKTTFCSGTIAIRRPELKNEDDINFVNEVASTTIEALTGEKYIVFSSNTFRKKALITINGDIMVIYHDNGCVSTIDGVEFKTTDALLAFVEHCI